MGTKIDMDTPIHKVSLLFAMEEEARPVIDALGLSADSRLHDQDLPFVTYRGESAGLAISATVSGHDHRYAVDNIGPVAATLMAYTTVDHFAPDLVISAGTAGGFSARSAAIGTVYLSDDRFVFHDRLVPLPGFDESAVGHYPAFNVRRMASALQLPTGVVSSGSSLQKHPRDVEVIEQFGAVAKEMEAAAVAWVCMLKNTPLVAVKSITNLLDEPGTSEEQFLRNLATASQSLQKQLLRVLAYLPGKTLAQLSEHEN
ncbi:phosphorylase family protein [Microbulbifer agarilyticus]|uniref:phosphorylase family protein n=1 Tax=Microbulbifer agarilyticus TaxID=260552 RepID=UPI001CD7289D|nr:hypothetical protein [Microbulbifer agarilyticus]MCA0894362.1 hypothetical protein [Microbulbifer agarilyticus]